MGRLTLRHARGIRLGSLSMSHLLSDPLCNDMIGDYDDTRPGDKPEGVEAEEGVVEPALFGVVFEGEEG